MRNVRNLTDFVSQFLEGYRTYEEAFQGSPVAAAPHIAYLYEGHGNSPNLLLFLPLLHCVRFKSVDTTSGASTLNAFFFLLIVAYLKQLCFFSFFFLSHLSLLRFWNAQAC